MYFLSNGTKTLLNGMAQTLGFCAVCSLKVVLKLKPRSLAFMYCGTPENKVFLCGVILDLHIP